MGPRRIPSLDTARLHEFYTNITLYPEENFDFLQQENATVSEITTLYKVVNSQRDRSGLDDSVATAILDKLKVAKDIAIARNRATRRARTRRSRSRSSTPVTPVSGQGGTRRR